LPRPERRSPRLAAFDYAETGAYLVTVCTADRACLLGAVENDAMVLSTTGRVARDRWVELSRLFTGVALDAFVVMPNHVHGIVWLFRAGQAPPLPVLVGSFKSGVSRRVGRRIWQRSFHDRVLRNEEELKVFRQYILDNPVKWAVDSENPVRRG
jgi:putative transposase